MCMGEYGIFIEKIEKIENLYLPRAVEFWVELCVFCVDLDLLEKGCQTL